MTEIQAPLQHRIREELNRKPSIRLDAQLRLIMEALLELLDEVDHIKRTQQAMRTF